MIPLFELFLDIAMQAARTSILFFCDQKGWKSS